MDLRQLRYFVEVANANGFNEAASRLHVSQSSVSRRIQDLELDLQSVLFERNCHGAKLTDQGRKLLSRALAILREVELARSEVKGRAEPSGQVTVGISLALSRMVLCRLARQMVDKYPDVRLVFAEGSQYSLMEGLETGRIDLAVLASPRQIRNCNIQLLGEEKLYWVRRPKSGRRAREVSLRDLDGRPLTLFPRPSTHRDMLDRAAGLAGATLNVRWELSSVEAQKEFIRNGLADAILPFSAVSREVSRRQLSATPIRGITLRQALVVRTRENSAVGVVTQAMQLIFKKMIERTAFSGSIASPNDLGWSSD